MQIVELCWVACANASGEEVRLLLVVAFQRYPVTRADDVVQQVFEPDSARSPFPGCVRFQLAGVALSRFGASPNRGAFRVVPSS